MGMMPMLEAAAPFDLQAMMEPMAEPMHMSMATLQQHDAVSNTIQMRSHASNLQCVSHAEMQQKWARQHSHRHEAFGQNKPQICSELLRLDWRTAWVLNTHLLTCEEGKQTKHHPWARSASFLSLQCIARSTSDHDQPHSIMQT